MNTLDFDYSLPSALIAQSSVTPRDHSRLMAVNRQTHATDARHFYDIVDYLRAGDLLVWNNSKVFKARLLGKLMTRKNETLWEHKRDVEIFLIRPKENTGVWQVLAKPGRHVRAGTRVIFGPDFWCDTLIQERDGTILVQFPDEAEEVRRKANQYGSIPIPPYVKDEPHELDAYQTVYSKHEGSVAAPTAGFHFTPELIAALAAKGVTFAEVTLHVGLGTFLPVKAERIEDHTMHSEWVELTEENAAKINEAKQTGRRVIAVGTTTVRTLEGLALIQGGGADPVFQASAGGTQPFEPLPLPQVATAVPRLYPYHGELNIFIKPGFQFRIINALITNFHLPKSTLLMLVSAFVGDREFTLECYRKAVAEEYRFFSFGDAMFIA